MAKDTFTVDFSALDGFAEEVYEQAMQQGIDEIRAENPDAIIEIVRESSAEIFTKDHCPYCTRAKALLEKHNIAYTEVSAVEHREALIERVTAVTGAAPRTVPQIFIDGQHIGGYDDLVKHLGTDG